MAKVFIDTNIFVRTVVIEDEDVSGDCERLLGLVRENKIRAMTSNLVLAEVVWVLGSYYKKNRTQITEVIEAIIGLRGLDLVDRVDPVWAVRKYKKHGVKFVDALVASMKPIREKAWIVVSYDKDFDKLGVVRKEPKELV
jgi:uncharacterized protein